MTEPRVLPPGSIVGVMGGGQLGRMFAIAARRMGYRVHTFSPGEDTPTGQLADREVAASYDDEAAIRDFARGVDVLTFEFENIPSRSIAWAAEECIVHPDGRALHLCQHRLREKHFLQGAGFPLPRFLPVESKGELIAAVSQIGTPCVLKTASFGYDGKGQRKIDGFTDMSLLWEEITRDRPAPDGANGGGAPFVVEAWVEFEKEISVIVARGARGEMVSFPVCENQHRRHILDVTMVPARIDHELAGRARQLAGDVAEQLNLVGVLAVEMFVRPVPGAAENSPPELLINELAPRPHNSGHFSFDASVTSQFEQQLRAVCGLRLGSAELLRPCAMANLLGDIWDEAAAAGLPAPNWSAAAAFPDVKIHLYGKATPRPGRKMGHLVAFGPGPGEAAERVLAARAALVSPTR